MDLHALIADENLDAVAEALARGADVETRNSADDTPLYTAMDSRSVPMVELLLAHGADPNAVLENRSSWDKDQAWIEGCEQRGQDTTYERGKALHKASPRTVLCAAVALWGSVELVQRLLDAGARVDAADPRGWTPLHFAAHGSANRDVLELLVATGADLGARNNDGHTPLALCCVERRARETKCLLRLGAPLAEIGWTELHLGALNDSLPSPRDPTVDLEALDIYGRTALHIAFQHRKQTAINELLDLGANARLPHPHSGPLLRMALPRAARSLIDRLLQLVDVNETSGVFQETALMDTLDGSDLTRRLLAAGADPNIQNKLGETAFQLEYHGNMAVLELLRPGSDWSPLKADSRATLLGDPELELVAPPDNTFRWRLYGQHNPTNMTNPWWVSLILNRAAACTANRVFAHEAEGGAVWCCKRFGQSLTHLDDDRFVEIAGEHEDWYDSNFCIYNDVIVHHPDGLVQVFGYPADVFPPTDFHSATLVDAHIYIIGNLGYGQTRVEGFTPVYRLTLDTWEMEPIPCTGECPGWIYEHEATLVDGCIHVSGGQGFTRGSESKSAHRDTAGTYSLDLSTRVWQRLG